ncbi:hypothetical protein AMTRI_Chr03g149650 [Amborella trichopoda]
MYIAVTQKGSSGGHPYPFFLPPSSVVAEREREILALSLYCCIVLCRTEREPEIIRFQAQFSELQPLVDMKGMKGLRFINKKLKSLRPSLVVTTLKTSLEGRVLQLNASDGGALPDDPFLKTPSSCNALPMCEQEVFKKSKDPPPCNPHPLCEEELSKTPKNPSSTDFETVDISELVRDLEEEEEMISPPYIDKENIRPTPNLPPTPPEKKPRKNRTEHQHTKRLTHGPLSEIDVESWARPPNPFAGNNLFDPDLLAAFEKAVMDHICTYNANLPLETEKVPYDPLSEFEEKCPPGGRDSVVLYTTSIRGIRKTFEDCRRVRHVLSTLKVAFDERDISMHLEFREQMRALLVGTVGDGVVVVPPRVFVRGRYLGGAEEFLALHEGGRLLGLLEGMPKGRLSSEGPCEGCGGVRFVLCLECRGSQKLLKSSSLSHEEEQRPQEEEGVVVDAIVCCPHCNENGLILCPICC